MMIMTMETTMETMETTMETMETTMETTMAMMTTETTTITALPQYGQIRSVDQGSTPMTAFQKATSLLCYMSIVRMRMATSGKVATSTHSTMIPQL